jgi:hypothetical protein
MLDVVRRFIALALALIATTAAAAASDPTKLENPQEFFERVESGR